MAAQERMPVGGFSLAELYRAMDEARQARDLSWKDLASQINAPFSQTTSLPISLPSLRGIAEKSLVTSAVALKILRWLNRTPESFLPASALRFGEEEVLPKVGATKILRLDTRRLYRALDQGRQARDMSWSQVTKAIPGFASSILTNLAKGPLIDFPRVLALTQKITRPLAEFVRRTDG